MEVENLPLVLIGDLNDVLDQLEKVGGKSLQEKKIFLKKFLQEMEAIDLGYVGPRFTWMRRWITILW